MADTALFDTVAQALRERTAFTDLEARGTLRLALKNAGLEARGLAASQLRVVLERLLPSELSSRGVPDGGAVCAALIALVDNREAEDAGGSSDAPEDLFRRTRERVS